MAKSNLGVHLNYCSFLAALLVAIGLTLTTSRAVAQNTRPTTIGIMATGTISGSYCEFSNSETSQLDLNIQPNQITGSGGTGRARVDCSDAGASLQISGFREDADMNPLDFADGVTGTVGLLTIRGSDRGRISNIMLGQGTTFVPRSVNLGMGTTTIITELVLSSTQVFPAGTYRYWIDLALTPP